MDILLLFLFFISFWLFVLFFVFVLFLLPAVCCRSLSIHLSALIISNWECMRVCMQLEMRREFRYWNLFGAWHFTAAHCYGFCRSVLYLFTFASNFIYGILCVWVCFFFFIFNRFSFTHRISKHSATLRKCECGDERQESALVRARTHTHTYFHFRLRQCAHAVFNFDGSFLYVLR